MAKVIRGGRRGTDRLHKYSIYASQGRTIRRAANPEGYKHSRSRKVKRVRNAFANVMVRYSALDIYKKQLWTEATALDNPILKELLKRKLTEEIRRRGPKPPPPIPTPEMVINSVRAGITSQYPAPYPNIDYSPWRFPDWYPWNNKVPRYGPNNYISDELPKEIPNPSRDWRTPLPPDVPNENIDDRRAWEPPTIYILTEIEPRGLTGTLYELYLDAKSEYRRVKRFIKSHKKEIIIIAIAGLIIAFVYTVFVAGAKVASGTVLLADESIKPLAVSLGLVGLPWNITWVKDWYQFKLLIDWVEQMDLWAWNDSRGWKCYKEIEDFGTDVYFNFYEGPDARHKGKIAATVHVQIDPDTKTAGMNAYCGESEDRVVVFYKGAEILRCNIGPTPYDIVDLYNVTQGVWGEARTWWEGNTRIWAFEDRPTFGDADFNDAYVRVTYDENFNPMIVEVIEGDHMDELAVYWRGQLIGWFQSK